MTSQISVEIGAVDVDFFQRKRFSDNAADLGEGNDALVAVVLQRFWRNSEQLAGGIRFKSFGIAVGGVACLNHLGEAVEFFVERLPFFLWQSGSPALRCILLIYVVMFSEIKTVEQCAEHLGLEIPAVDRVAEVFGGSPYGLERFLFLLGTCSHQYF